MNPLKVIVFRLKDEEYAIDVNQVHSIEKIQNITRVPGLPSFNKGVINLRGQVTPIIDLKDRFGMGTTEYSDETRFLIVSIGEIVVGLIVDAANDVIDINQDEIDPTPGMMDSVKRDYYVGVVKQGDRLFVVLQIDKVISYEKPQGNN